jgi:hypothetical protein
MTNANALAAGQGGADPAQQPTSQLHVLSPDEVHRQSAVEELAGYLARSGGMLARCETMSKAVRGDRLGPIFAAARLMNANAQVARALAHVALVESRRRVIVETIQPPQPKNAELNSGFPSPEEDEQDLAELNRRIDALIETKESEQERLDSLNIGCCI